VQQFTKVELVFNLKAAKALGLTFPPPALTSSAGDQAPQTLIFPRVFPRVLVEGAQHRERHGLNPCLDGRLRHRREQGRVVARRLWTFALDVRKFEQIPLLVT
jgi:hypothetical protein